VQIKPEQLDRHLQEQLAPVYFISGDDPLRVMQAADAVRAAARGQGYDEREVLTVETGFDWGSLQSAAGSLSLFSARRIVDLRLPGGKPGDAGSRALRAWAEQPPEDTLLLITSGKLDPASRKGKWVQALGGAGVVVFVWPLEGAQYLSWVRARMRQRGLQPSDDAVAMLAARVEGNLLACVQEIDKLYLLRGAGPVAAEDINAAVADSARFDIFGLVDAALAGEAARSARMLQGLRGEGTPSAVVLWALAKEVRQLVSMARQVAAGQAVPKVLAQYRVWQNRKAVVGKALQRLAGPGGEGGRLLRRCALVDRVIKGQAVGNEWDELLQLLLLLAGVTGIPASDLN
jgi:DNA polymerase-3 subunit delta